MFSLPSVTIDAGVLAVPDANCTKNDAFQYVDTLLDWSQLLEEPWVTIYMSEHTAESLFSSGLFPLRDHLKALFKNHGIVEYDVNTVAKIANQILNITPYFENYYRVKDVLLEQLETHPDVICFSKYEGLQSNLARCVTLIAILRKYCPQPLGGHSLILRKVPNKVIQVRVQIHELEHTREDIPVLPCPPEFFEGDVLVCDDFHGLIECIDESVLLVSASDNLGIDLAIRIALFRYSIAQGYDLDWGSTIVPIIGSKFRETCQQICSDQGHSVPSKILRSIVETIKGENLQAVHALRTGIGGNDPQRMRGTDKALRRDIDRELHLHYWECSDGKVELASVVYHKNFSIPG